MGIFENKILKPEEQLVGFIPGQDGDDIFQLEKLDSYTGNLPNFEFEDTAVTDVLLDKTSPNGKRVEREPKKAAPQEIQEEPAPIEEEFTAPEESFAEEELNIPKEDEGWGQDYYNADPEPDNSFEEDLAFADNIAAEQPEQQDNFDPELKALLEGELERTSERRKLRDMSNKADNDGVDFDSFGGSKGGYESPFGEVPEFMEHPEVIAFDDIKADKPSQYGLKDIADVEANDESQDNPKNKSKKKKKQRTRPLWQIITFASVATLILIGGIIWGIFKFVTVQNHNQEQHKADSLKAVALKNKKDQPKHEETPHEQTASHTEPATHEEEHPVETPAETHTSEPEHPESKPAVTSQNEIPTIKLGTGTKHDKPVKQHNEVKDKPKQKPKDIVHKKDAEKETYIYDYSKPPKIEENNNPALYAVQIYASPSKEDAEDWVLKLKKLKAHNIRIENQRIRGVNWYKVRFGEFTSIQDARAAAKNLGFAQSWIDRIK